MQKKYDVNIEAVGYLQDRECEEEYQEEYEDYKECDEHCAKNRIYAIVYK